MSRFGIFFLVIVLIALGVWVFMSFDSVDLPEGESVVVESQSVAGSREILETDGVRHSVPLDEIRQGCPGRDCIPSVDNPDFIDASEANDLLPSDTVGIGLDYKGQQRFYPFNMLVTREIVNDTVAGDPVLVTYCPLCGTGIVFDRRVDGVETEFGVSGLLWQSNLLMYDRGQAEGEENLWSQVLGEAVVGPKTGTKLEIISSDIVRYSDWVEAKPDSLVLNTGRMGDPYGGDYYGVARQFRPNFDEDNSPIEPDTYVVGIEINDTFKAYPVDSLPTGLTEDVVNRAHVEIYKNEDGTIRANTQLGKDIPIVNGFWFSWVAAHPSTLLFGHPSTGRGQASISELDPVPDFSFEDLSGEIVSLSDFRGQNILVNSWAAWCPFCVDELPDFVEVAESEDITIIAINRRESKKKQQEFLSGLGIEESDLIFLHDPKDEFYKSIGGFTMPETLFVNEAGEIVIHKRGVMSLSEIRDKVIELREHQ